MDSEEFLKRVLPPTGTNYYIAVVPPTGGLRQFKHNDIKAVSSALYLHNSKREDVYFATGTYRNKRQQKDTEEKKCFYVDLDVGAGGEKYETKREACEALIEFGKGFLPPSIIVDSGGGLHGYWTLTNSVPRSAWQPVAEALKRKCAECGLLADSTVTADSARILRMPGSVNWKNETGRPTKVIHSGADYEFSELKSTLQVAAPVMSIVADTDDLSGGLQQYNSTWSAASVVDKCPMFKSALETGGAGLEGTVWGNQLLVLTFCEDGESYKHQISDGHELYSYNDTEKKWAEKLAAADRAELGPTLCKTFSEKSPHCKTCRYFGKVNSPLHLGGAKDYDVPDGYGVNDTGVYRRIKEYDSDGNESSRLIQVTDFQIQDVEILHSPREFSRWQFVRKEKHSTDVVEIDLGELASPTAAGMLNSNAIYMDKNETEQFRKLAVSWAKLIKDTKGVQYYSHSLGWADNPVRFVTADKVLLPDGSSHRSSLSQKDNASLYIPKGAKDTWLDIGKIISAQKRYETITAVLTSFASPLLHFLPDSSVIMSFTSNSSATGKTTALYIAQAVWGDPTLAINQTSDTANSILSKLGYLNSLPAYWDEVRVAEDPTKFMMTLFQLVQGREKSRLNSSSELRKQRKWESMFAIASNESIADHAKVASPMSEAGRVRVFEIPVPELPETNRQLGMLVNKLSHNYGHIGEEYAEFICRNHKPIEEVITKLHLDLTDKEQQQPYERFWFSTASALLVACKLANKLGYLDIDYEQYRNWLIMKIREQRADVLNTYGSTVKKSVSVLSDYLSLNQHRIVVQDKLPKQGMPVQPKITFEPRAYEELAGCIATEENAVRLNRGVFSRFCRKMYHVSVKEALVGYKYTETRSKIIHTTGSPRVHCFDVQDAGDLLEEL